MPQAIHALRAIHDALASIHQKQGGKENPYREGFAVKSAYGR
jgi:hypothetical protein